MELFVLSIHNDDRRSRIFQTIEAAIGALSDEGEPNATIYRYVFDPNVSEFLFDTVIRMGDYSSSFSGYSDNTSSESE